MDAKAAGQLIGAAGVGIYKAVRGLIRKAPSDDRSDRSSVDIELVEKSKSTPTPKTKKPGKVTLTDPFVPPADVQHGSTLHRATEIKTALTDYADALDATSDQLARAQAQLSKDPPNFKQAKLDVEAMATDMLSNDLRNLQEGLGLDRKALHGWLISADRTNEADPVASLKTFLTTQLQTAGHSAPQSAAMAGWLFDQIMVAGSVCLTAQTADHNTFKTYLNASVTHIRQAWHVVRDEAAVDRLMSIWASARGDGVQDENRERIRALIQQAVGLNSAPNARSADPEHMSSIPSVKPKAYDGSEADGSAESSEDSDQQRMVKFRNDRAAEKYRSERTEEFHPGRGVVGGQLLDTEEKAAEGIRPITKREGKGAEHSWSSSFDELEGAKKTEKPPASKKISAKPEGDGDVYVLGGGNQGVTQKLSAYEKPKYGEKPSGEKNNRVMRDLKSVLAKKANTGSEGKKVEARPVARDRSWGKFDDEGIYQLSEAGRKALQKLVNQMRQKGSAEWTTSELVGVIDVLRRLPGNPYHVDAKTRSTMMETEKREDNVLVIDGLLTDLEGQLTAIEPAQ